MLARRPSSAGPRLLRTAKPPPDGRRRPPSGVRQGARLQARKRRPQEGGLSSSPPRRLPRKPEVPPAVAAEVVLAPRVAALRDARRAQLHLTPTAALTSLTPRDNGPMSYITSPRADAERRERLEREGPDTPRKLAHLQQESDRRLDEYLARTAFELARDAELRRDRAAAQEATVAANRRDANEAARVAEIAARRLSLINRGVVAPLSGNNNSNDDNNKKNNNNENKAALDPPLSLREVSDAVRRESFLARRLAAAKALAAERILVDRLIANQDKFGLRLTRNKSTRSSPDRKKLKETPGTASYYAPPPAGDRPPR